MVFPDGNVFARTIYNIDNYFFFVRVAAHHQKDF